MSLYYNELYCYKCIISLSKYAYFYTLCNISLHHKLHNIYIYLKLFKYIYLFKRKLQNYIANMIYIEIMINGSELYSVGEPNQIMDILFVYKVNWIILQANTINPSCVTTFFKSKYNKKNAFNFIWNYKKNKTSFIIFK